MENLQAAQQNSLQRLQDIELRLQDDQDDIAATREALEQSSEQLSRPLQN